ncbi:MAG: BamA/TamA family outer membrane protein [Balneolales bacterium]
MDVPISNAQSTVFGKNRVQYDLFDWRYIQSDHFDVYYYDSRNYYLAEFSANSLEAAYTQLSQDLDHDINDRISVIVYDSHTDFTQTNVVPLPVDAQGIGGVTDKYKNRITIPFLGDYADYRQVLHHELLHAVFNDMFYGGSVQSIMQNNIQLAFPLWFEEGLAEFTSQGWDTDTDMFIRDAVMNNYLPPIPQLQGYFSYRGGQAMWDFIVQEYGREKIAEILQRIRMTRSVPAGMRQALGLSLEELSERWHDWLRVQYWPEIEDRENLKNIGTLVTEREMGGSYNVSPTIAPQGDRIALITNRRGYFDVVVVSAIDGSIIKTLVRGEDNVDFEELNILRPNLTWSPDGNRLALATRTRGNIDLAIIDYNTEDVQRLTFPDIDAIGSVSWSPDGDKLAFNANAGPYTDIFVYNLETEDFHNVTSDVFSDNDPSWTADSRGILFASDRGGRTALNTYKTAYNVLLNPDLNQSDIYMVNIGDNRARRLTNSLGTTETRPLMTRDGRIVYISDLNGIPNVYELNEEERPSTPLTNLITGVQQMSISADGTKLAVNSYNEGYLDIFMINNPFNRAKSEPLKLNKWADRRMGETSEQRVPALGLAHSMFTQHDDMFRTVEVDQETSNQLEQPQEDEYEEYFEEEEADTVEQDPDAIDFRNYVFGEDIEEEYAESDEARLFSPEENKTEDGRFVPRKYRLSFSPDLTYAGGTVSTGYGVYAVTQMTFSDLLGDHRLTVASNLVFDLRNSDYQLSYGYFRKRTNYLVNYFHTARNFQAIDQNFDLQLVRYRFYGGGVTFQYPLDKFSRIEYGANFINISRDFSLLDRGTRDTEETHFLHPEISYTKDVTQFGITTPVSGTRYNVSLTGSPPLGGDIIQFVTLMGDYRRYLNLGASYSVALRASGGVSFGRDAQNFFLGGMENWVNFKWADGQIPIDRLEDIFFTQPALPLRGHVFNSAFGDKYGLFNAEFRFPLFAAILPGPVPLIPLYNITGGAFVDAGSTMDGNQFNEILVGSGFGLRTILLGMPFRWDIGWPYDVDNGFGSRIHYFSIGLDF